MVLRINLLIRNCKTCRYEGFHARLVLEPKVRTQSLDLCVHFVLVVELDVPGHAQAWQVGGMLRVLMYV